MRHHYPLGRPAEHRLHRAPDGAPLDLGPVVAHAIDDPTAAYALQGWLTACGVRPDYRVDTDGELQPADAGESHESARR